MRTGHVVLPVVVVTVLVTAGLKGQHFERGHDMGKTEWSYEGSNGPDRWGDLDPQYAGCKLGKEQSPIDIRIAKKAYLPAIRFEYKNGPLKIVNNGHTAVRVDYAPGNGNFLIVGAKRYELTQFHFHRPSEEYIQGKPYDMSIHLIHVAHDGKVAAVAVLLKTGGPNQTAHELWKYMPRTPGKEYEVPGVQLNPAGLLPRDTAYYTYAGSLTAPPCTEGVTWFVLKTPADLSAAEVKAFAELYPHNVRPLQPINQRAIAESQ